MIGLSESHMKKAQDLMDGFDLMQQPPPADWVPDPKYAWFKLGRREQDACDANTQTTKAQIEGKGREDPESANAGEKPETREAEEFEDWIVI